MTTDSEQAAELASIARDKKLILMVGHIFRYSDALKKLKKEMKDVKEIHLVWKHNSNANHVLWDLAPHMFDIINYLTNAWGKPKCVMTGDCRRAIIIGEAKRILYSMNLSLRNKDDGKLRLIKFDEDQKGVNILGLQRNNTIKDEITEFINCIENKTRPSTDPFLGYMTVKKIEECLNGYPS